MLPTVYKLFHVKAKKLQDIIKKKNKMRPGVIWNNFFVELDI